MLETRRHTLDALRAGPALFTGLPGDEVDLDRLAAHLAERRIDGGIYATDGSLEGLLWIQEGAPGEAWFFEAGGQEAVLPVTTSRDLLLEIASRDGRISVFVGAQPSAGPALLEPPPEPTAEAWRATTAGPPVVESEVPERAGLAPVGDAAAEEVVHADAPREILLAEPMMTKAPLEVEPPAHPWPAILTEVMVRVLRHRGPRLGAQFSSALARALEPYGGRMEGDRVVAPQLPESVWRTIVDAGCAPVVAVAGRAFIDRTIAAAERAVQDVERTAGEM